MPQGKAPESEIPGGTASETRVSDELKDGASEVDIDCVRKPVQAIGQCAIGLEKAAVQCVDCLLDLVKTYTVAGGANRLWTSSSLLVQEAIIVIKVPFKTDPAGMHKPDETPSTGFETSRGNRSHTL